MAGRDEPRGRDLDDWFDEPASPSAPRAQANHPRDQGDATPPANGDDWLGDDAQPAGSPRFSPLRGLSEPRLAVATLVALLVLLGLGLALSGAFSSATPRRTATTTVATNATTTTATSTATQPQSSATAAPSRPLKPGDQGSEVTVLQRALASLGYSPGAVDGNYGSSTQRALARFQSSSTLTPDGILGPLTLVALRNTLKGL